MSNDILTKLENIEKKLNQIDKVRNPKKWLSVKELSEYLGISTRKIRDLIKNDRIPVNKIDSCYKFNRNKIDLWLEYNGQKTKFTTRDKNKLEILQ